jgi:hypothetical protein
MLFETQIINPTSNAFEKLCLEEQIHNDDSRPFFIERNESGLNPTLIAEVDDLEAQRTSPYAFHFVNENLELHRDLFLVDDEEDEGNLRNQIRGKLNVNLKQVILRNIFSFFVHKKYN